MTICRCVSSSDGTRPPDSVRRTTRDPPTSDPRAAGTWTPVTGMPACPCSCFVASSSDRRSPNSSNCVARHSGSRHAATRWTMRSCLSSAIVRASRMKTATGSACVPGGNSADDRIRFTATSTRAGPPELPLSASGASTTSTTPRSTDAISPSCSLCASSSSLSSAYGTTLTRCSDNSGVTWAIGTLADLRPAVHVSESCPAMMASTMCGKGKMVTSLVFADRRQCVQYASCRYGICR
mmetsp:Transcript_6132/g.20038  ORF Transcript_6132/g.20038 Transcript_6132/m.20038 type:complete len:238 (-) Transcript_6132:157-870(-)